MHLLCGQSRVTVMLCSSLSFARASSTVHTPAHAHPKTLLLTSRRVRCSGLGHSRPMMTSLQLALIPPTSQHPCTRPELPHLQACALQKVGAQQAHDDFFTAGTDTLRQGLAAACLDIQQGGCKVVGLRRILHVTEQSHSFTVQTNTFTRRLESCTADKFRTVQVHCALQLAVCPSDACACRCAHSDLVTRLCSAWRR